METLFLIPFRLLEIPNIKIKKPSWLKLPSAMTLFSFVLVLFFLVTGGIMYDMINEPPSMGTDFDESGKECPKVINTESITHQYIVEGLAAGFFFTLGSLGFIILDRSHNPSTPKLNRMLLISFGFACIIVSFVAVHVFMKKKLPMYKPSLFYTPPEVLISD